jgi:hypothetical protein
VTNPTSPARSRDPRRAKLRRAVAREVPLLDRAPLLRFSSPSAFAGSRCAVRAARLRTIPLRRSSPPLDPRPRTVRAMASPLRFSALRMRCGEARYADNPLAVSHTRSRRVNAAAQCAGNRLSDDRRCEDRPVKPDSITLRNDPSHQAPPLRSFAARNRSCAVGLALTAAFRYRFEPSRPGRTSGPSLCTSSDARGVLSAPFAGLLPRTGDDSFLSRRAHLPVRPVARPD